jgi:hypothetical protein
MRRILHNGETAQNEVQRRLPRVYDRWFRARARTEAFMRYGRQALAGATAGTLAISAFAADSGPWEKASVSLGAIVSSMDSSARVGTSGTGLEVDVEEVLGLETTNSSIRIDALYRFGQSNRHRVDFTWFDLARDATRTLETEIEIGGTVFPVGTTVQSEFDLAFYNLRYSYSFLQDDRIDLAGSVGVHVTEVGLSVSSASEGTRGEQVTAPLPLLGLRMDVLLTSKWYIRSSWEGLYLAFDGAKGLISDTTLAVEYRPWKRFSMGAGVNAIQVSLEGEEGTDMPGLDFAAKFDFNYTGLLLYGKVLF